MCINTHSRWAVITTSRRGSYTWEVLWRRAVSTVSVEASPGQAPGKKFPMIGGHRELGDCQHCRLICRVPGGDKSSSTFHQNLTSAGARRSTWLVVMNSRRPSCAATPSIAFSSPAAVGNLPVKLFSLCEFNVQYPRAGLVRCRAIDCIQQPCSIARIAFSSPVAQQIALSSPAALSVRSLICAKPLCCLLGCRSCSISGQR